MTAKIKIVPTTYGDPFNAGDLGEPWVNPENAASVDGLAATTTLDAETITGDTTSDLLARPVSFGAIPSGASLASLTMTLRAWATGPKGSAAWLSVVRFTAGAYTSSNLAGTPGPVLTTTPTTYSFDLADAPSLPTRDDLAAGGQWQVRLLIMAGSVEASVDALTGAPTASFIIDDGRGLLGRNYRGRNWRDR